MVRTSITVVLDAERDLYEAGYDQDDKEEFERAWTEAAEAIAEEAGIELDIVYAKYDSPDDRPTHTDERNGETLERRLWQAAHDLTYQDDEGRWRFDRTRIAWAVKRL